MTTKTGKTGRVYYNFKILCTCCKENKSVKLFKTTFHFNEVY